MKVSVVIPAYNAREFVSKAVDSAGGLDEVQEILLVEDGARDGTLEVCLDLERTNPKVRVLRHAGGANRGAGASRNLGIEQATQEFIAFLDADDFYLPNRFHREREIFSQDPEADGVYGATGTYFVSSRGEHLYNRARMKHVTTVSGGIPSDELAYVLLGMSEKASGHFHLNALTVRKRVFDKAGLFDEALRFGQDTHLIVRLAFKGKLLPGCIDEPVAMRGVHDANRVTDTRRLNRDKTLIWGRLYEWGQQHDMPENALALCRKRSLAWHTHRAGFVSGLGFLMTLPSKHPDLWADVRTFRKVVVGVFGDNLLSALIVKSRKVLGHL